MGSQYNAGVVAHVDRKKVEAISLPDQHSTLHSLDQYLSEGVHALGGGEGGRGGERDNGLAIQALTAHCTVFCLE